jgi:hypothetical protein
MPRRLRFSQMQVASRLVRTEEERNKRVRATEGEGELGYMEAVWASWSLEAGGRRRFL